MMSAASPADAYLEFMGVADDGLVDFNEPPARRRGSELNRLWIKWVATNANEIKAILFRLWVFRAYRLSTIIHIMMNATDCDSFIVL